jgi:hypothetical protein
VAVSASAAQSMSFLIQKPRLLQAKKKNLPKYTGKQKLTAAARILFFHKLFFIQ